MVSRASEYFSLVAVTFLTPVLLAFGVFATVYSVMSPDPPVLGQFWPKSKRIQKPYAH